MTVKVIPFNLFFVTSIKLFLYTIKKYISIQIPPAPPRPDFDASREKLQRLGEGEGALTREEFLKMKEELEE